MVKGEECGDWPCWSNELLLCFGFRVQDFGFRVQDFGFRVQDFEFRVQDFGCRVQNSEFRDEG